MFLRPLCLLLVMFCVLAAAAPELDLPVHSEALSVSAPSEEQPLCGNHVIEEKEQCDPPGGCCDANCQIKPKGHVCRHRHENNACDVPEQCNGFSPYCPKNRYFPDGTVCDPGYPIGNDHFYCLRGHCEKSKWCGNGIVEKGEMCDPPGLCCDAKCRFRHNDRVCRKSTGPCDAEEKCTGSSAKCPFDDATKTDGNTCQLPDGSQGQCSTNQCAPAPSPSPSSKRPPPPVQFQTTTTTTSYSKGHRHRHTGHRDN